LLNSTLWVTKGLFEWPDAMAAEVRAAALTWERPARYLAPSWSWLSLRGAVLPRFDQGNNPKENVENAAELLEVETIPGGKTSMAL
jgi:hypothetical protein